MLYSHNQENEKLKLFTSFLNRALQGDEKYTSVVNDVILETHAFAVGEKTLYNVNRDLINIILLLNGLDKPFFEHVAVNPNEYNQETYTKVLDIISAHAQAPIY